ncbi:MAG: DoxX family membrane protein [Chitinophagia bacterium]|nr:DoxX family membrane protein [Chitinophagia bacterium]
MQIKTILFWILRLVAAVILLQTLRFKFGGLPESVYIFTKVGMEPWGRIGSGVVELIASILILWPRTTGFGALFALGTMSGAIFFHLTTLGIDVMGDGGQLFYMAIAVWVSCAVLLVAYKDQPLGLLARLKK